MEAIAKRAGTPENILFRVSSMFDQAKARFIPAPECAVRTLTGKGVPGSGGKARCIKGMRPWASGSQLPSYYRVVELLAYYATTSKSTLS